LSGALEDPGLDPGERAFARHELEGARAYLAAVERLLDGRAEG
jgi:hypothetical protein